MSGFRIAFLISIITENFPLFCRCDCLISFPHQNAVFTFGCQKGGFEMTNLSKGRFISWLVLGMCLALTLCWIAPTRLDAQVLYGSITGNVVDPSGAAIPGAEVTVINKATNYTQTAVTTETGGYSILNVPRGTYTVKVSLSGFKEYVDEEVVVTLGDVTRKNVTLEVGEITEAVTVSAVRTELQTDTTDIRAQIEAREIVALPLGQFRNYQTLLNLVPGATPGRFQNAITDTPGRALTTNINGTARNMNNTRIDGAMSVNIWLPHHTAYVPPSETIDEVNISTNNFDAETGFAGGAAVTLVSKSGGNDFHGSVFAFHENSALMARDFFNFLDVDGDGKADKPNSIRNIDGFTVGGPILKDRLFYFGGFEATVQRFARTSRATLATAAMKAGDFSGFTERIYDPLTGKSDGTGKTPFLNNKIPANRMSAPALKIQSLLPNPNLPGLVNNFEKSGTEAMDRFNYDTKIDYFWRDTHRIWGKFSWLDAEVKKDTLFGQAGGGAVGGGGDGVGLTDVKVYGIGHNWTLSPTFLVDGNFGFTDMDQQVLGSDIAQGNFGKEVLGIPGVNAEAAQQKACLVAGLNRCAGVPRFSVDGFSSFGQVDGWTPIFRDENSLTFTHNFSWIKRNHEVRFGYDLVKHMLNHWQPEIGSGPRGAFSFSRNTTALKGGTPPTERNGWASFLLGLPSSYGKSLQWELMTTNEWQHAMYVRDRWQFTPNLTLTLGLRYEYFPLVTRDDRKMEFLDLKTFEMVLDNNIKASKKLFAPRVGFAYRLNENNVIRSGYGITYSPIPFGRPLRGFYPLTVAANFTGQDSFVPFRTLAEGIQIFTGPDTRPGARIPLPQFVEQRTMPPDGIKRGYIQSWNVVYERKFPGQFVIDFAYVGTQTVNQLGDLNLNWAPPGGGTSGRKLFPKSTSNILFWNGYLSMNYHSLQVAINRRFKDGLFVKGAYTYSHAINMTDDEGWAGVGWNDPALFHRNRAQAGFNRPHILQLATVYELPFARNLSGVARHLLDGWQVNGIFSMNSNTPFTVGAGGPINNRNNTQTADQVKPKVQKLGGIGIGNPYFDRSAFARVQRVPGRDCTNFNCYGNSGRNILRGPDWINLDFSVFRHFKLTEGANLEFRTEFFNLSNTPHFNNPSGSVDSSAFFWVTSTDSNSPNRILRFALRLEW